MKSAFNFSLPVSEFDSLRAIIKRDEENDAPRWTSAQARHPDPAAVQELHDLQRRQFERGGLRRALGIS